MIKTALLILFAMYLVAPATSANAAAADTTPVLRAAAPVLVQRIVVHAESRLTEKKVVQLEDIAEFSGFDGATLDDVKALEITEVPRRGEKKRFTNIGFAQILRQKLLEVATATKVELVIPNEVLIVAKSLKIETSDVESELLSELKKQCGACEFEISGLVMPIVNQDLPSGASWKIKIGNQIPKGSFSIPLEIKFDDHTRRLYWIAGNLTIQKLVPVAKRIINSGDNIKEDDFSLQKRDVTFLTDSVASAEELKASVAARGINANQVIEAGFVRKPSAIRSGDLVKVMIGDHDWQVSMDGVAQQNAYKGDSVKVKISRTQKIVSGIAIEPGMVEVR